MKVGSKKETILVVDNSLDTQEVIKRMLSSRGYKIFTASNVGQAVQLLNVEAFDLVITDLKMEGTSGLELVKHISSNHKNIEIMMITGYPSIETAIQAVKDGASDYIIKPFTEEELFSSVENILERVRIRKLSINNKGEKYYEKFGIIGTSKIIKRVFEMIEKSSKTTFTVLITGESGVGKELVARAIHYSSERAKATFVPVNCGGIPEELLESELFGYVKGAFTGATESRAGFFQTADGGTIFLDEVSEMSVSMQVKLLRVLQDKEVYMIGSRKSQKVNVRIIAATNKNLIKLIEKGDFREDLYYRLNVISIEVPPLRERGDDIIILTNYFAKKFSEEIGKPTPMFTDDALLFLKQYHWSGNVRELENLVSRLIVMSDSEVIDIPDLPSVMRFSVSENRDLTRSLSEMEMEYIKNVLENVNGNKSLASKILKIDRIAK